MNWQEILKIKIDAIGDSPTIKQQENLVSWVIENVPVSMWGEVAFWLPGDYLGTQISMRAGESGF